jgi:hypothetical protein
LLVIGTRLSLVLSLEEQQGTRIVCYDNVEHTIAVEVTQGGGGLRADIKGCEGI